MTTNHKVFFGDSCSVLPSLEPESVALVVTSPPYFVGMKYEEYLKNEAEYWDLMEEVFHNMAVLVEPFGKVVINFPDRYANAGLDGYAHEVLYSHVFDGIMNEAGFDLWARIIWDKNKVFIDGATHLASPSNKTGQMRMAPNWEYIFVWRKHSEGKPPKKEIGMTNEQRIQWTDSIWTIDSVTINEKEQGWKLAKFPEEIPYRFIQMYTEPGDLVLDPFGGACTVGRVSIDTDRDSTCVERNTDMEEYIRNYLGVYENGVQEDMFTGTPNVEFIHFIEPEDDYNYELSDYLYDVHRERAMFG